MTDDGAALFDIEEAAPVGPIGRVEAGLVRAVAAGQGAGILVEEDLGMIMAAMAQARHLDTAERLGGKTGGYLAAQLATPYREMLAALRLPAAVAPSDPRAPAAGQTDTPDWLRDAFGTPTD